MKIVSNRLALPAHSGEFYVQSCYWIPMRPIILQAMVCTLGTLTAKWEQLMIRKDLWNENTRSTNNGVCIL